MIAPNQVKNQKGELHEQFKKIRHLVFDSELKKVSEASLLNMNK